ncbi:hypothetical protein, partial [Klebsiella pneumoniae]|uniref:hypothetical protein n=1 Tax=Klebsiella pneumoniae TaxID=573 RepID=UPI001CDAB42A
GGKNSLNRLIRCVCGKKIGPDPRNFNQRVSLGRNDLLIRTFPNCVTGGVANVTDGDWLYFLDHYASEKYRRYRYFSQVTACPAILLKISSLIW